MADMTIDQFLEEYSDVELTEMVTHVPEVPTLLSGFFEREGMDTTLAHIEVEKQGLRLVPDTKRQYEGPNSAPEDRHKGVYIEAAHLVTTDFVLPKDLQNVRKVGSSELTTVDYVVTRKLARMRRNLAATLEWHRVGAVKGQVLDADGTTVLYDIFDLFGVEKNPEEEVPFPTASGGATDELSAYFDDLTDRIELGLGGNSYGSINAIVGKDFWTKLTTNPRVYDAYIRWTQRPTAFGQHAKDEPFYFGGVNWYRYNKSVAGKVLVEADTAHVFPEGPDILKHYFAPAQYLDTVNTIGQEYYSRAAPNDMMEHLRMTTQSNPLTLCMFPEALFTLKAA